MMEPATATIGLILFVACLVAMVSQRLRLPYSVGLVVAGIGLALLPHGDGLRLSRDLIFTIFLPPLVFEAALALDGRSFLRELPATALLAFPGVAIAAGVVAAGAHWLIGWSWIGAGLFGVLIAATDPVSVVALFREVRVTPRLALLVEAESLLNDGAASIGFAILAALAVGGAHLSAGAIAGALAWAVGGGILAGMAVAGLLMLVGWRTEDRLIEVTLTVLAAYGSFLVAERLHASGVLASLTAGLVVGRIGWRHAISEENHQDVRRFWDVAAFLANSIVFILIGSACADLRLAGALPIVAIAIPLVLAGRALSIYPLAALLGPTGRAIPLGQQHVLFWGGLRGALALALALALPDGLAERGQIVAVAFTVVAFSIFAQGLTIPWLVRRLRLRATDAAQTSEAAISR